MTIATSTSLHPSLLQSQLRLHHRRSPFLAKARSLFAQWPNDRDSWNRSSKRIVYNHDKPSSQPSHPMTITTTELPEALQKLFLEVEQTNQSVTITHQGKPIVIITPANPAKPHRPAFGFMQGQGEILGDIIAPVEQPWEAIPSSHPT